MALKGKTFVADIHLERKWTLYDSLLAEYMHTCVSPPKKLVFVENEIFFYFPNWPNFFLSTFFCCCYKKTTIKQFNTNNKYPACVYQSTETRPIMAVPIIQWRKINPTKCLLVLIGKYLSHSILCRLFPSLHLSIHQTMHNFPLLLLSFVPRSLFFYISLRAINYSSKFSSFKRNLKKKTAFMCVSNKRMEGICNI